MTTPLLESLHALLSLLMLPGLWLYGRRYPYAISVRGWGLILAGFALMAFGNLLDLTDNFPSLDRHAPIGGTDTGAWLGIVVGHIGGLLLVFMGFLLRLPEMEMGQHRQRLLDAIVRVQASFIGAADSTESFDRLLRDILDITGSEYGFIAEVLHDADNRPYLKSLAVTNIAWDDATRAAYAAQAAQGMEFTNIRTLFGAVLTSGEPVISNNPAADPRRGGLPPGHPTLDAFLGVPIRTAQRLVAVVGIANRPGGYDFGVIEFLQPLSGTIAQLIEARHDSLTRRTIEQSLRRLSLVASRTTNGVIITDAEGRVEWVNEGFQRITGYTLADMLGRRPGDILQGAGTDPAEVARIRQALRRGESFEAELLNYTRSGRPYWVHVSVDPMRDYDGRLQGYMGIETDISARKSAEAGLAASAQHTRAVLDNVLDGIITIDGQGIVTSFNLSAERLFGYAADEVIGRNIGMLMPEPHRSQHDAHLRRYQATGVARVVGIGREVEGRRKDGSLFPIDLAVTEIRRDGQPLFIGMVRDITERKRLDRLKNEFLATVSHELRTPLTSIRGALGLIAGGALGPLPEAVTHLVDIANKNSAQLNRLIDDLLDMEKMAADGMHFDPRPHDLMPLVEQAVEAIRAYGEARRVSFHLAAREAAVQVQVDAQRFLQVMANLLSNAAKFSPVGAPVEIAVTRLGETVRVAVSDLGPGIPADFRDRIFEKFSQADASDARRQGGTGLGLAITRELVRRMNGQIGFESMEGAGTSFHVDLPVWRPAPEAAGAEPPEAGGELSEAARGAINKHAAPPPS